MSELPAARPRPGGSPPRFSVIIPSLDEPAVDKTLAALVAQDYPADRFEGIVVGMDPFGKITPGQKVHFESTDRPLHPPAARNRGARLAAFEILAFLDADCLPQRDWLSQLALTFSDASVSVVGGGVRLEGRSPWEIADNLAMFHDFLSSRPAGLLPQLASLNMAIRRDVFDQVGGFDERYIQGEDSDLSFRLRRLGYPLHFRPQAVVAHYSDHHTLRQVLAHHLRQGRHTTKMDPRHTADNAMPWPFRSSLMVLLGSPLLAGAVTLRLFAVDRAVWRYAALMPVVYLAKLAWCLGAARHVYDATGEGA